MTRITAFSNPLLVGFETIEKTLDCLSKSNESYPPYNIERIHSATPGEGLRITVAVAGFLPHELNVTLEGNHLIIRGQQDKNEQRDYLHRGIASRQFQRIFIIKDGMEVSKADLKNGLLSIDLTQPMPETFVKHISITAHDND